MWTKPGYNPDQSQPPAEQGKRLASLNRGEGVELRVTLAEYEGRPYLSLRVWERGRDGKHWPVKGKGVSVRLSEARTVAEALLAAIDEAEPPRIEESRDQEYADRRKPLGPPAPDMEKLRSAAPTGSDGEFNEFD